MAESTTSSSSAGSKRRVAIVRRRGREVQNERSTKSCHCGVVAPICTSWTDVNPGRRFYGCRNYQKGGCGYFKWLDEEMGERPTEVINELLGHVDRLYDDSMKLRVYDGKGLSDIETEIGAVHVQLKKIILRMRLICGALLLTWILFVVYILS